MGGVDGDGLGVERDFRCPYSLAFVVCWGRLKCNFGRLFCVEMTPTPHPRVLLWHQKLDSKDIIHLWLGIRGSYSCGDGLPLLVIGKCMGAGSSVLSPKIKHLSPYCDFRR